MLFILGLVLFFGAHGFLTLPNARQRLSPAVRKLGVSALSIAGIVLIVFGWSAAGAWGVLWTPPAWTRHITLAFMLPALILLAASQGPNSHIRAWSRHPMLAGVKIWALAHLLANGEWRSIALFGAFLAFAVIDRIAVKRRGTSTPGAPEGWTGDIIAVGAGVVAYVALAFWLHPILFGVQVVG